MNGVGVKLAGLEEEFLCRQEELLAQAHGLPLVLTLSRRVYIIEPAPVLLRSHLH